MKNQSQRAAKESKSTNQAKLFQKDFTLVIIGQIFSLFGNAVLRFALPLYIFDQSGSPALFGLVSASAFLPMIIMSPIGGIIADRVNKQRIMVALDFFTAALILAFILLKGRIDTVALVMLMMMALYSIKGAYTPAVQASIPLLVKGEELVPANAVVNIITSLSSLLGPIMGGMFYGTLGLTPILTVSGGCFAFSAVLELFINIPHKPQRAEASIWSIVRNDMTKSLHFIMREKPVMSKIISVVFLFNLFLSSMIIIGLPVIIIQTLNMSSQLYGIAQGALATGGLIGGLAAGVYGKRMKIKNAYILMLMSALATIPIGLTLLWNWPSFTSYLIIVIMSAVIMINSTLFNIQMLAFTQGNTPIEMVGKVISLLMALVICAQPIGQALYGMLYEKFDSNPWVVVLATTLVAAIIAILSKNIFSKLNKIEG